MQKVQHAAHAQKANGTRKVAETTKADEARKDSNPNASNPGLAVEQTPVGSQISKMISGIEQGQGEMDKVLKLATSGAKMNNQSLLAMQVMVFKYSQELDLTGKVVDKATSGLKDTLKTQV